VRRAPGDRADRTGGRDPGGVRAAPPRRGPGPAFALDADGAGRAGRFPGGGAVFVMRLVGLSARGAGRSETGRVREVNEDRILLVDDLGRGASLFAVADGLGGHARGEDRKSTRLNSSHLVIS